MTSAKTSGVGTSTVNRQPGRRIGSIAYSLIMIPLGDGVNRGHPIGPDEPTESAPSGSTLAATSPARISTV